MGPNKIEYRLVVRIPGFRSFAIRRALFSMPSKDRHLDQPVIRAIDLGGQCEVVHGTIERRCISTQRQEMSISSGSQMQNGKR